MKLSDITLKNVKAFVEGNYKHLTHSFGLLSEHEVEQVYWRMGICKDTCMITGKCRYCKCSVPGKLFVKESCNEGELFPNLMSEKEWEEYKITNKITIEDNEI